jgi:hypothetical protein
MGVTSDVRHVMHLRHVMYLSTCDATSTTHRLYKGGDEHSFDRQYVMGEMGK